METKQRSKPIWKKKKNRHQNMGQFCKTPQILTQNKGKGCDAMFSSRESGVGDSDL
jgi:hypothetical protein